MKLTISEDFDITHIIDEAINGQEAIIAVKKSVVSSEKLNDGDESLEHSK